jgi:cutinase
MGLPNRLAGSGFLAATVYVSLLVAPLAGAQPPAPTPVPVVPGPGPAPDLPAPPVPPAPLAAPACPDVEVVFARGTTEAPGVGAMGQAFVDDLRPKLGARTVGVYAVDYPASPDFPTAVQGVTDASTHVQEMAANCPDTQMVLGGYSQGAAVMGFVTTELVPDGVSASEVPAPMPPDIADHVSAVALLGTPSERFMGAIRQPAVTIGPLYEPKTLELCVPNDFVCSAGNDFAAHARYVSDGLVMQAADFAASKVAESKPGA